MKIAFTLHCTLVAVCITLFSVILFADTIFVKFGAAWKYMHIGSAAPTGSGAADWRNIAFADGAWSSGPAKFGYGDGKESTTVNYGGNPAAKYITTFFRQLLNIVNIGDYGAIRLNAYLDDGAF